MVITAEGVQLPEIIRKAFADFVQPDVLVTVAVKVPKEAAIIFLVVAPLDHK